MIDPCSVYIFGYPHAEHGHVVKVGIAKNVFVRLETVQTHNPNTVIPYFHFDLPSRATAFSVEKRFHDRFKPRRLRGEWFGMGSNEALYFLTMIIVRDFSTRYFGEQLRHMRDEAGLLRAFKILDREHPVTVSQWDSAWNSLESEAI